MTDLTSYIDRINNEEDIFSKARLIHHLVHEKGVRIVDVAKLLGKHSSYICHLLRLVTLPEMVIDGYYSKLVSVSHLFIISRIKDKKKLLEIYEEMLKRPRTIEETEELVRLAIHSIQTTKKYLSQEDKNTFEQNLRRYDESINVKIIQTLIKSKIIIEIKGSTDKTTSLLKSILEKVK